MKRTVQVNVKMTQEDFELLRKAAEKRWPDAVITKFWIIWTEQKRSQQAFIPNRFVRTRQPQL